MVDATYGRDGAGRELGSGAAFQIASVSKTFAAACALWPVDQCAISLDDPVRRWIGALPASWSCTTLRQLLTHTSGLCHWGWASESTCVVRMSVRT